MSDFISYSFILNHSQTGEVCTGLEELKNYLQDGWKVVYSYQYKDCVFVILEDVLNAKVQKYE